MDILEGLESIGIDLDIVLHRFSNNAALLERFLLKFPKDKTYSALKQAVEEKDYASIESDAHTLKGIAANLGFDLLSKRAAEMVDKVRANDYADLETIFEALSEEYEKIIAVIERNG
ncbi:Hpt domain-containing protein [Eubacterium sp. 1001713B170207_170306_E7]|uniref:Hpt domain-containing protein n=1 Tax=Eubacterium sp. 1001713B170207_170306_E7 TaxID=2787097 RepID=UPI0018987B1B|nr:Hpt domain-containing protein [Eubacterium sp. 1001713B170207_170306_E7]